MKDNFIKTSPYEKRIHKLVKAYKKAFGYNDEESRKLVEEEIAEDCIESVEESVADGLLSVSKPI